MRLSIVLILISPVFFRCHNYDHSNNERISKEKFDLDISKASLDSCDSIPLYQLKSASGFSSHQKKGKDIFNELLLIIKKRDLNLFVEKCNDKIIVNFGGALIGIDDLSDYWELETKKGRATMFDELDYLISQGFYIIDDSTMRIPYFANDNLYKDYEIDDYKVAITIKDTTAVFDASLKKIQFKLVGHCIAKEHSELSKNGFTYLSFPEKPNLNGYVKDKNIYKLTDNVLTISRLGDMWQIIEFCPGL